MNEDLKKLMKNESLSFKLKLLFNISLRKIESIDKNNSVNESNPKKQISNLPKNLDLSFELEDIKSIQKLNNPFFLKFLYINRDKVNELLYNEEVFFTIDFEIKDKKISQYIYLCFLIEENEICNYQYPFELINKLNEIQRGEKEILKKIFIAKMIISLVYNYNQIDDNEDNKDNKHEEELQKISEFNSRILDAKDNITILNQYGLKLEGLKEKKIEELYSIIFKYLIEKSKLEDSGFIESIIKQIELESIILTKSMLDELTKILEKEYIKKYEIKNFDDILNKRKINFYYNLIKYILKQSLYIYQIPFLLETRKKILNLIKNNLKNLSTSIKNCENAYKIEYILKQFISDNSFNYYYNRSESIIKSSQSHNSSQQSKGDNPNFIPFDREEKKNMNDINDSSIVNPLSLPSFKSAKKKTLSYYYSYNSDNFDYEEAIEEKNEIKELQYKILNKSRFKLHTNKSGQIPFIIYDEIKIIINEEESEIKTIEEIRNINTSYKRLSNNYKKFLSFLDNFEESLLKEFNNKYKLIISLNFNIQSINNDNYIVTCLYDVNMPGEDTQHYKDTNILSNGLGEGFRCLLLDINSINYSDKEYS